MMDLFTLNDGKRIRDTKRVGREIMSPEAMEINSLTQPQAWFDLSLLYTDTDLDG